MKNRFLQTFLAAVLLVFHISAFSEDTDLFTGLPPSPTDLPNVLILLDNTANWNNAFTNEIAALKTVITGLPINADGSARFRIGFMLFTESGGGNTGPDGGYIRAAVRPLTQDYKNKLNALLTSFDKVNDKSNGGKLGNTMADAYRYLAGLEPYTGHGKDKSDYVGNISGTAASNAIYALPNGHALLSKNATEDGKTLYQSPVPVGSCGKNFIIYISNGAAQDNNSDTVAATNVLKAAAGGGDAGDEAAAIIALSPSGSQVNVGDEWARFMKKSSLSVVTYTIDVDKVTTGQGPGWSALLKSMANVSDGKYFDVSSGELGATILKAMEDIFSEIQSDNSVFASVSLPVSVNTQGTYRNQVYIGMFRPDSVSLPRWDGNLKQYRMGYTNNVLMLQDATEPTPQPAINASTGFISECVRSYWTPTLANTYWANRTMEEAGCLNADASDFPDGNIAYKGAQGFRLRAADPSTRILKTCSGSCTALTDFNNSNVSADDLGASTTAERNAIINWTRGQNVDSELQKATSVMRPSVHGDVVHSRPVAINFGTEEAPQVAVFYGANDGVLRAVNGNRTAAIGSVAAGSEMWAFVAPEYYKNLKRIRDNNIKIDFPGNLITTHTPLPKPYAIDGPISAYKSGSNAWVYATMRRGGRALYAFNVNTSNPSDITLKWKKGCPDQDANTGCTVDSTDSTKNFNGLGQTWSTAKTLLATGFESGTAPLLIMGGGYDKCEDADTHADPSVHTCNVSGYTPKGKWVYVMDANTGALLNTLETDRSVVADIVVTLDKTTGKASHAYAVDLGGNVYRINIGTAAPADWTITKLASLGCDTTELCGPNRKFMFAPDLLVDGETYILLVGSGDREKPLNSTTYPTAMSVANHFFMIKDKPSDAEWLSSESANCGGLNVICKASLYGIAHDAATPTSAALIDKKGWYLSFEPVSMTHDNGVTIATEQVVTSAITIFDVVTFSTHTPNIPAEGSCTNSLGTAKVYNIVYKNAQSSNGTTDGARYRLVAGGGLPPSPVAGMVTLDDGSTVPFCIGCNPKSPLEGGEPPEPPYTQQPKARVYWYIQK